MTQEPGFRRGPIRQTGPASTRATRPGRTAALVVALVTLLASGCSPEPGELLRPASGGDGSVASSDVNAFSEPAANLDTLERRRFERGDALFIAPWVPASGDPGNHRDGLGPLFNAASCATCHLRDGRAPDNTDRNGTVTGLVFRIGIIGSAGIAPHPTFGHQLQTASVTGVPPEPGIATVWEEVRGTYDDGTPYTLRRPAYRLPRALDPVGIGIAVSPRIAPAIIGLGLLEAIPEEALLAAADPDDRDGDGISGRLNRIGDATGREPTVGRFGWKANVGTLHEQVARAFRDDIGITSSVTPLEPCTVEQPLCGAAHDGGRPEISDERLADVVFYASTLAVPERRGLSDPEVRAGAAIFEGLGCVDCHTASFVTGDHPIGALAHQAISPFTDLLLHDLGPDLADTRPDGLAQPEEWRTAPLWGLGLTETVGGPLALLHDGRARSIEEAILWHGGEAEAAKRRFTALDGADRRRVIAFLESL